MATASETADGPVREARKALFPRLVDAAEAAGISAGYLSMLENGLVPKRPATRERVAKAFNSSPAELWGER